MGKAVLCLSHGARSAEGQPRSRCAAGGCVSALRISASVLHAHRVTLPQEGPDTSWNYDYFKPPKSFPFPSGKAVCPGGTPSAAAYGRWFWGAGRDGGRQGPGCWDAGTQDFWMQGGRDRGCCDAGVKGCGDLGCRDAGILGCCDAGTQDARMQGPGILGCRDPGFRDAGTRDAGRQ